MITLNLLPFQYINKVGEREGFVLKMKYHNAINCVCVLVFPQSEPAVVETVPVVFPLPHLL